MELLAERGVWEGLQCGPCSEFLLPEIFLVFGVKLICAGYCYRQLSQAGWLGDQTCRMT